MGTRYLFKLLVSFTLFQVYSTNAYNNTAVASTHDELSKNDSLVLVSRNHLYEGRDEVAISLLRQIDTLILDELGLGYYYLTKGFLKQMQGIYEEAIIDIQKAMSLFENNGSDRDKAEVNLIWGIILERASLDSEAAKKYFEALDYYLEHKKSIKYFYSLLGLARTAPNGNRFLSEAETFVLQNPKKSSWALFYYTKGTCVDAPEERQSLFLNALEYNDQLIDFHREIVFLISLALNSQLMGNSDSANYYMNLARNIVDLKKLSSKKVLYYYLIHSYIHAQSRQLEEAGSAVDSVICNALELPGLLGQAYRQKYYVEKARNNYILADDFLMKYIKIEKEQLIRAQQNQLSLLTIRYDLRSREIEVIKVRNFWLSIALISILGLGLIIIAFFIFRFKSKREKNTLKNHLTYANAENKDLQKKYDVTNLRLLHQTKENIKSFHNEISSSENNNILYLKGGTNKGWSEFLLIFNMTHPLFINKLKKTKDGLSDSDMKYCICIFDRKSNMEIAHLLVVTPSAVKKAKQKLKRKFNVCSTDELILHLQQINDSSMYFQLEK